MADLTVVETEVEPTFPVTAYAVVKVDGGDLAVIEEFKDPTKAVAKAVEIWKTLNTRFLIRVVAISAEVEGLRKYEYYGYGGGKSVQAYALHDVLRLESSHEFTEPLRENPIRTRD